MALATSHANTELLPVNASNWRNDISSYPSAMLANISATSDHAMMIESENGWPEVAIRNNG
jgi:hypothetical protein